MKTTYTHDEMYNLISRLQEIESLAEHYAKHFKILDQVSTPFTVIAQKANSLQEIFSDKYEYKLSGDGSHWDWYLKS